MPFFSLICPTRDRMIERSRLLNSLEDTITDPSQVEIIFIVDKDDLRTQNLIENSIERHKKLNIKYYTRNRSYFLNRDYYNWASGLAEGEYHWAIGDDLVFKVKGWDKIISERIKEYIKFKPDNIVFASIKDNTPKPTNKLPKFPCFPLVSKTAIRVLGFLLHPNIPTWGADYALYCLYKKVDRVLLIEDRIYIEHISYHTKQANEDAISKRVALIFNQLKNISLYNVDRIVKEEVPLQANILSRYINERKEL